MSHIHAASVPTSARVEFFKGFLRAPSDVGSITPSSRFLERAIVSMARLDRVRTVVELGPGTGGTTRALLRAMPDASSLLAIELDPVFADIVAAQRDPRLLVHRGGAESIAEALQQYHLGAPQVVVSGIPFSSMPRDIGERIIRAIRSVLEPDGMFLAYQVRSTVCEFANPVFGRPERRWELRNVPPMRLFRWRCSGGAG